MQLDTAISEVQQICGWRSDRVTQITSALQYAQTERERPGITYPWFLRQTKTITTVVGTQEYALPTGYIQDTEEKAGNLYIFTGTNPTSRTVFLRKMDFEIAQQKFFGTWPADNSATITDQSAAIQNGIPDYYVLEASTVRFYPTPDAIYTVYWRCWAADAAQALGQTNLWLTNAPWVLIGEAAKKIGADLGNSQAVATASEVLAKAEDRLFRATIHREEAGRVRAMGSRL